MHEPALITALLVTCFVAITAYCIIVAWPKIRWLLLTAREGGLRPQARVARPRPELQGKSSSRPPLLKR